MSYQQLLINGNILPIEISKIDTVDLLNYYQFITQNTSIYQLNFKTEVKFTGTIKCINWFEYKYNNLLKFIILKARDISTNETYYFQFIYYNYVIYTENDIKENSYLSELYKISKYSSLIHDITSYTINDGKIIQVQHYNTLVSFAEYCINIEDIMKDINKTIKSNFIILRTNFLQNRELSSCENTFNNFRFFTILNNIKPAGTYLLDNVTLLQLTNKKNIFFVKNDLINIFFKNFIEINQEINKYYLSFDLESEVTKELKIDSEKNILTHCGIEYFNTAYYKNQYLDTCVNFCLVNLDFHYKYTFSKLLEYKNTKNLYDLIRSKSNKDKNLEKLINQENEIILKDDKSLLILEKFTNIINIIDNVKDNNKKYIFIKEQYMIEFFFTMLKQLDIDIILSYNGHSYDFPQLCRRYTYLCGKTINKSYVLQSLYGLQLIKYTESNNDATNFNIKNLIIEAQYFSIDVFNYIKKFHPNLNSYSLKEVSKNMYIIEALCIRNIISDDIYEIIPILNNYKLKDFLMVLLTANYCYINDISYKIIDKTNIINNNNCYNINLDEIINDTKKYKELTYLNKSFLIKILDNTIINHAINNKITFDIKDYEKYIVKVQLSKDDVPIFSTLLFENQTTMDVADYCIHDTILCRHLYKSYYIEYNLDIFANLYYLPQNKSLIYRNTTNIQGYMLKTSLQHKTFYIKSKKFILDSYTGGKVLSPKEKFIKEPVLVYDFESLYPSIMINYNVSPDKLVLVIDLKDVLEYELIKKDVEEKFNSEYYTIIYIINHPIYTITIFSKIDENLQPSYGLLNMMLLDLKTLRQYYKNEFNKYQKLNNEFQIKNCNLLQNNIKVLANSTYGNIGSSFSNISCKFTSQAITAKGASFITFFEQILDGAKIENNKIYIIQNDIVDKYTVCDKKNEIYNPFIEKYMKLDTIYDFDFNYNVTLKLVYGDTDSIMIIPKNINLHENLYNTSDEIYKQNLIPIITNFGTLLNTFIKNNLIINNKLNLQFENIIINMILQSKKKYTGLSIEPNSKSIIYKEINKGISIKRRDICEYQKKIIYKIYEQLNNIIISARFNNFTITEEYIITNIWTFLKQEIKNLIKKYLKNKLNISDFLITCSYTENYKFDNNHIEVLVNEYNKTARNLILKGDRFDYIYLLNSENHLDISQIDFKNNNLHKLINWQIIDSKINDYKVIYDNSLDLSNKRIALEIYVHKVILNIISIFNDLELVKKKLLSNYKMTFG